MAGILNQQQDTKNQVKISIGLLMFYSLMVWALAVSLDKPGAAFDFRRHHFGTLPQSATKLPRQQKAIVARSGIGVLLYLLVASGAVFLPIPEPGITGTVLDEVYPDRGGGLWEKEPERAIEVAALYFLIIGLAEITVLRPSSKQGGGNAPNE